MEPPIEQVFDSRQLPLLVSMLYHRATLSPLFDQMRTRMSSLAVIVVAVIKIELMHQKGQIDVERLLDESAAHSGYMVKGL